MPIPSLSELILTLQNGSAREQYQAALILSGYRETQAVEALGLILNSTKDSALQDIAIKSLGRMGPLAFDELSRALGGDGTPGHSRHVVRAHAAEALGKQDNPAAINPLLHALKDPHPDVRKQAAGALIHYKEDRSIEELKQVLLNDPDASVRNRAASVLQAMGITAPVNIPTIITVSKPVSKPLPPLRSNTSTKEN
jgi:HEAT repeat protein